LSAATRSRSDSSGTRLQREAKNEDYLRHQLAKYGEPLPIWIAVEFLGFGALVRLYGLLDRRDQNTIAKSSGSAADRS
jgi:abortive infection bacteriophage resistance protein